MILQHLPVDHDDDLQEFHSPFSLLSSPLSSSLSKMKNTNEGDKGSSPLKTLIFDIYQTAPSKFQLLTQEALNDNLSNDVVNYRERKLGALHCTYLNL